MVWELSEDIVDSDRTDEVVELPGTVVGDPFLVLFCEDKWNTGEPELHFASCLYCYDK